MTIHKADPARRRWQPAEERIEIRWVGQPPGERLELPTLDECREAIEASRERTRRETEIWRAAFDEAEAAGHDPHAAADAALREFRGRNKQGKAAAP